MASKKVELMSINATKAGMEGLDKAAINAIIEEASKGSKFYEAKAKAQQRIDAKKDIMRHKLKTLGSEAIKSAEFKADKLMEEISVAEKDFSHVIVHVDMDAFYAAVEERDNPSLKSVPMAVGSMGMLSTSNYLARKFGVRAGMPGFIGKKLCPKLKIVPLNFDKYRAVSSQVRQVFKEYDPNFCPMSLDEAYLDLTQFLLQHPSRKPGEVVEEMRRKIQELTTLTASAGISFNTMLAKICSDLNKPNGQYELLDEGKIESFVSSLSVRKVGGIGNVTEQLLQVIGVETCADIISNRGSIFLLFSELSAVSFYRIALGVASTDIADMSNRERKSMSTETTFKDTSDPDKLRELCTELCSELASDLQGESLQGRQITLKIKTHKFSIKTKVANLMQPTSEAQVMANSATKILQKFIDAEKPLTLRLLGVRMSDLSQATVEPSHGIKNFFSQEPSFECPLCGDKVQARNETAFFMTHFEKCSNSHDSCASSFGTGPTAVSEKDPSNPVVARGGGSKNETSVHTEKVICPICQASISQELINAHIDVCLNQSAIEDLTKKRKNTTNNNSSSKKFRSSGGGIKAYFTSH